MVLLSGLGHQPGGRSPLVLNRPVALVMVLRMNATSAGSYGCPFARKMSWNQTRGSAVYSLFQESHG